MEASGHLGMVAVGADKILHFILAAMIALAVGGVTESSTLGLVAGLIAGAGKEILNALTGGTVELLDFMATLIGAVLGLAMLLLVRF